MIAVPSSYPGPDEFIALVTRMRIADAWDPQHDGLLEGRPDQEEMWSTGPWYQDFIFYCVGFFAEDTPNGRSSSSRWHTCPALVERGFVSFKVPFHLAPVGVQPTRYIIVRTA